MKENTRRIIITAAMSAGMLAVVTGCNAHRETNIYNTTQGVYESDDDKSTIVGDEDTTSDSQTSMTGSDSKDVSESSEKKDTAVKADNTSKNLQPAKPGLDGKDVYKSKKEEKAAIKEENIAASKGAKFSDGTLAAALKDRGYEESTYSVGNGRFICFKEGDCEIELGADTVYEAFGAATLKINKQDYASAIADEAVKKTYLDMVECIVELNGDKYDEETAWEFMTEAEKLKGHSKNLSAGIEAYANIYAGHIEIVISPATKENDDQY